MTCTMALAFARSSVVNTSGLDSSGQLKNHHNTLRRETYGMIQVIGPSNAE